MLLNSKRMYSLMFYIVYYILAHAVLGCVLVSCIRPVSNILCTHCCECCPVRCGALLCASRFLESHTHSMRHSAESVGKTTASIDSGAGAWGRGVAACGSSHLIRSPWPTLGPTGQFTLKLSLQVRPVLLGVGGLRGRSHRIVELHAFPRRRCQRVHLRFSPCG